jgi:hypothetical protein
MDKIIKINYMDKETGQESTLPLESEPKEEQPEVSLMDRNKMQIALAKGQVWSF